MSTVTKEVREAHKVNFVSLDKISDVSINVRFSNNLDIATMMDEIALEGRVRDAIDLWLPADEVADSLGSPRGLHIPIRGNRRFNASKRIANDPDNWSASLVAAVSEIPARVHTGLTLTEAEEMVLDHNSMKRIAKSEIVNSIFRRYLGNKSEMDIILEMHRIIGEDLVNKADKVKELEQIADPKKRRDFARKWLHTFVGNYLVRACKLGSFVREQVLLKYKSEDGLLEGDETVHFLANTSAIQAISAAKTEDDKDASWEGGVTGIHVNGNGIEVQGGGNATKRCIEDLIIAHKSGKKAKKDDGPKVLSKKELEDRKDSFQSRTTIGALKMALGFEVPSLADDDIKASRREQVENVLKENIDQFNCDKVFKTLLLQIVDPTVSVSKIKETCQLLIG